MGSSSNLSNTSWIFKWSWQEMCGPDGLVVWSTTKEDIGLCFQDLCLKVPVLTLLAGVSAYYCGRQDRWVLREPWVMKVIFVRSILAFLLAVEPILRVCYRVKDSPTSIYPVNYLLCGVESFAWLVHVGFVLALRHRLGVSPRGPIVVCVLWTVVLVLNTVTIRSFARIIREGDGSQSTYMQYYADIVSLVIQCLYLLTLIPGSSGTHAIFNNINHQEQYGRIVQSDERQALLSAPRHAYNGFREEQDPGYLGVAMEDTTISSRLLFHWVRPLMVKGIEKQLNSVDDLFDLPEELSPSYIHAQLEAAIGHNNVLDSETCSIDTGRYHDVPTPSPSMQSLPSATQQTREVNVISGRVSLVRALHVCFAWEFYSIGILKLVGDCMGFAAPLLLNKIVSFIEFKSERKEDGYFFAAGLCVVTLISSLCNAHFNFLMAMVGVKIRAAIVTLIYRKTLSLSQKSLSNFSSGEIMNFMSTDTDRIVNSCPSFHAFWSIPFQLAVTLFLLYQQVGLAFLAGLGFAIILIPLNKVIAMKIGSLSTKMMKAKDQRVEITSEALRGIRTLKMHVWEEHFLSKILCVREAELSHLKGRKYLDALCVYFWATTPVAIAVLTFTCYALFDGELTAARVFTTMALLNMLIAPLNAFPWVLNGLIEAWVSVCRIQELLYRPVLDIHEFYHPLPVNNTEVALFIRDGKFEWGGGVCAENRFQLTDINITILKGQLVGIVGEVGSGKSSLLAALLAEPEKLSGVVAVDCLEQGVAFVAQEPWLQRGTIRDNILFGKPFDPARYSAVLEACCLEEDLELLSNGDLCGVGEGAFNLSGGQKARIALARAVYQDKETYVFDDILSAVDPLVANSIFEKCILKLLHGRTRILCTHYAQCLRDADVVVKMVGGRIAEIGSPADVLAEEMETWALLDSDSYASQSKTESAPKQDQLALSYDEVLGNEFREAGSVRISVYVAYWKAIGSVLALAILISLLLMQSSRNLSDWWMSYWVSQNNASLVARLSDIELDSKRTESSLSSSSQPVSFYLTIYGTIAGLNSFFTLLRAFAFAYSGVHAATVLHKQLIKAIIRARVTFFDISPLGRIINRLSSDTYTVDDSLPFILNILLAQFFGLVGALIVTLYGLPWLCIVLIPLVPIYHWLQEQYRQTSRELKRISSVTLSPVYSHFTESLCGLLTIRAFRASHRFKRRNEDLLESNQKAVLASQAASQWLGLRLQLIGVVMVTGVGVIAVVQHQFDVADPGIVGLTIAYALSVTSMLGGVVNAFSETEREMVSVERVHQYVRGIERESQDCVQSAPFGWPTQGVISFKNVTLKYREHLSPSLKQINFETRPLEKIGVVGRTGAGKSSLLAALFRMVEVVNGCIYIDSINIANLSLHNLRSQLAVIPQDPFLFAGTVRDNIDPLKRYDDNEIYDVLNKCHMSHVVRRLGGLGAQVGAGGSLFSAGQKQLLCLSRAILRNAKVLCIDEATASVDLETDRLIQKTIKGCFRQSTVITIAHRIETIMDSDRVLVLGGGEILEFSSPDVLMDNPSSHFYQLAMHLKVGKEGLNTK